MSSATPLLSIIIPTYNRKIWLEQSLRYALSNLTDWAEVVVGNNASTDGTEMLSQIFRHPRLRWYNFDQHVEMKYNWDRLLNLAAGEWIQLMSDDDFLLPQSLPKVQPLLCNQSYNYIIGSSIIDKYTYRCSELAILENVSHAHLEQHLQYVYSRHLNTCLCSKFIRKRILQQVGGFGPSEFDLICDADQMYKAVEGCGGIVLSNVLISRYSLQPNSVSIAKETKFASEARLFHRKWRMRYVHPDMRDDLDRQCQSRRGIEFYYWRYRLYAAAPIKKIKSIASAWKAVPPKDWMGKIQMLVIGLGALNAYAFINRRFSRWWPRNRATYWWTGDRPPALEVWPGMNMFR